MRALTLSAPWSHAVAYLGKPLENRTWAPPRSLVGERFAIHTGRSRDEEAIAALRARGFDVPAVHPPGVICVVRLRGVLFTERGRTSVWIAGDLHHDEVEVLSRSMWLSGPFSWVLGDVLAIDRVIPCKGAQGLWRLPSSVETAVQARIDVATFNARHPVGTPVRYWRGLRAGAGAVSRTRSAATLMSDHASVWIEGVSGSIALSHVEVLDESSGASS